MASRPAQSSSSAFFVTVGRGLENFAADEIRAKLLASRELGCQLGLALTREFGWKADLRKPQLEVIAHLNNEAFIVGFPLTRVSLANRSWCRSPGLRATVAHAVAVLAGVQSGAKVLDPMCGSGTILLEATMEWKSAYYIGADIDCSQLSSASRNIASSKQSIDLIKASVLALPLQSSSVDVIVCDMPFGRRFGRGNDIMSQTRSSLQEMIRVLVSSGILVLLVSQTMSQEVIKMVEDGKCCQYKTQINNALVDITKCPGHARKCKPDERACGEDASRTVYVLSLQEVVPVSLGETEASIHKYIKIRLGEKKDELNRCSEPSFN
uniref:THUMP domain containing 2 n=1 Tax=Eptatretus burgeri TaxID=7764 RepID=A0A8C4QLV1_EPTBU